jgi:1-acyl-sn-glycerol-3-phosphate acyltransferase
MSAVVSAVVYEISFWAVFFVYVIGFRLRAYGARHIPRHGAVLVVANHQSLLDPVGIGLGIRRHLHYLAKKTLFTRGFGGWWMRTVNCVPVDQDGVGKDWVRSIVARLDAGKPVLVFPEGERSEDGLLHPLKPGVGLLLKRVKVPIVPAGIAGAHSAWPRGQKVPVFSPLFLPWTRQAIAVVYGPPRDPATLDGKSREQVLALLHEDIAAVVKQAELMRAKQSKQNPERRRR